MTARPSTVTLGRLTASQRLFLRRNGPIFVVYTLIAVLFVIGATQSERFLTERNLANVARQSAFLGIVALGQMLVILTAGIDLSIGSLVKVSILVSAIVMDGEPSQCRPSDCSYARTWAAGRLHPRVSYQRSQNRSVYRDTGLIDHPAWDWIDHFVVPGWACQP